MISEQIKSSIEEFCTKRFANNPVVKKAESGQIVPQEIATYLATSHRLLQYTPIHLKQAIASAQAHNRQDLVDYFTEKYNEEQGHDKWAENDIKKVRENFGLDSPKPAPHLDKLLVHLEHTIDSNPESYVCYILLAEYTTVLMGPTFIANSESCGVTPEMLSVIGKHVELDKHHVAKSLIEVNQLVSEDNKDEVIEILEQSKALLDYAFAGVIEAASNN